MMQRFCIGAQRRYMSRVRFGTRRKVARSA